MRLGDMVAKLMGIESRLKKLETGSERSEINTLTGFAVADAKPIFEEVKVDAKQAEPVAEALAEHVAETVLEKLI